MTLRGSSGVSAAAGAIIGVLCTLGAARLLAKPAPVQLAQEAAKSRIEAPQDRRLDRLSARVSRLERTPASSAPATRDALVPRAAAPLAEAQADPRPITERAAADFASEPVDFAWARSAAASFDQDLRAMSKEAGDLEVLSVECRSRTCRTTLRFTDTARGEAAGDPLLHHHYRLNCARTVFEPEAAPTGGSPEAALRQVYFHCGDNRGVDPEP